ncbi:hypothetical protein LSPH26S_04050 [Lysinibacillus sphaericus]
MTTKLIHKTIIFVLLLAFMIPHISDKELALADTSDLKVTGTILHLREGHWALLPHYYHIRRRRFINIYRSRGRLDSSKNRRLRRMGSFMANSIHK